jgi:hypothetical protein
MRASRRALAAKEVTIVSRTTRYREGFGAKRFHRTINAHDAGDDQNPHQGAPMTDPRNILYLSESDLAGLGISTDDAIHAIEEMIRGRGRG